jgi:hypothetical protein
MMMVMLVAGIGLVVAGLLAIGYGVQYKEFSVGSTLILSGVVGACAGMIMIGLWMAVRELKAIAQRFGDALPAHPYPESPLQPAVSAAAPRVPAVPADNGFLFTRDQPAIERPGGEPATPAASAPPPWHEEAASRTRSEGPPVAPPARAGAAPRRRNLLFSSTSRKERERAEVRTSEALTPDLLTPELRPNPPAVPPALEPSEPQPATFETAWPRADRPRPAELPRRSPRTPASTPGEAEDAPVSAPERHPPAPSEEQPPVTVLKSGVVDGMAYSLYSDGSIEAQMPEGMMRFASIDELRSHLDQRS